MIMMASRFFLHCRPAFAAPPSWRFYTQRLHNKRTEEYKNFKRKVTAMRAQHLEDHRKEERMLLKNSDCEEARMEKEREVSALQENERERERMAKKREKRMEKLAFKQELKCVYGAEIRERIAAELKERRAQEVAEMIESSKNFVTMENLDEKIEEVLSKESNYNFALSTSGNKIGPHANINR